MQPEERALELSLRLSSESRHSDARPMSEVRRNPPLPGAKRNARERNSGIRPPKTETGGPCR
jgi:hypothetical protein